MSPAVTTTSNSHLQSRLKKRQRGWHYEREPGFHAVKERFEDAAKKNKEMKLAAYCAIRDALSKYALLDDQKDPVKSLTQMLSPSNFGYDFENTADRSTKGPANPFGPIRSAASGDAASRESATINANKQFGGV